MTATDTPNPWITAAEPVQTTSNAECSALPDTGVAERGAPLYADVAALLNGGLPEPPAPVLLARTDGVCLFYAGQVNQLFGDPESGKTWIALAAVVEALHAGRRALVLDLDHNGVVAIVARLLDLGAGPELLGDPDKFRYTEPEDAAHLERVVADARTWRPAMVIVDSIGELLPLLRLSSNSPDDFTTAHSTALKPFAQAGAAVIAIDHLAKNPDSRTQGASGTAAKRRAVGGTSLRVTVKDEFAPGHGGSCYINVFKDRHGGLRKHCPSGIREPSAGVFTLRQVGERLSWEVVPGERGDSFAANGVRDEDIAELDGLDPPPTSQRDVQKRLRWGGSRALMTLNAWRDLHPNRSGSAPQERGSTAPRSATPYVRSAEHSPAADVVQLRPPTTQRDCRLHPSSPTTTDGKCPMCILGKPAELDKENTQ